MKDWSLKGKVALVTGGTSGIGFSIAEEFLNLGAQVIVTGRDSQKIARAIEKLRNISNHVHGIKCDTSSSSQRVACIESLTANTNKLDILVNNVGPNFKKNIFDFSDEEFYELINTNLISTYQLTKLCYPLLKHNDMQSSIINISAITSLVAFSGSGPYGMAKAGIESFTRSLAAELGSENIRANAILPGFIATDAFLSNYDETYIENATKMIPLSRMGVADDISKLAAFLAMPVSSYITGQCICVDGGFTIAGLTIQS